jgi:hypothetical protein
MSNCAGHDTGRVWNVVSGGGTIIGENYFYGY